MKKSTDFLGGVHKKLKIYKTGGKGRSLLAIAISKIALMNLLSVMLNRVFAYIRWKVSPSRVYDSCILHILGV